MIPRSIRKEPKVTAPVEPERLATIDVEDIDIQLPNGIVKFTLKGEDSFVQEGENLAISMGDERILVYLPHVYWISRRKRKMTIREAEFTPSTQDGGGPQ